MATAQLRQDCEDRRDVGSGVSAAWHGMAGFWLFPASCGSTGHVSGEALWKRYRVCANRPMANSNTFVGATSNTSAEPPSA
jgi:hypothetical protein